MTLPTIPHESTFPKLYRDMRFAIAACHRVEELKEMTNKAEALAAYFKAANDEDSLRKVHDIKLRAWRRIGEILLSIPEVAATKSADAAYTAACSFCDLGAMKRLSVKWAIDIARWPESAFDAYVDEAKGKLKTLLDLISPGKKFQRARESAYSDENNMLKRYSRDGVAMALRTIGDELVIAPTHSPTCTPEEKALIKEADAADEKEHDVGITLQRKYRRPMRVFSFYMSFAAHEQLRKAAFDRRRTMHHLMRDALDMWFIANRLPPVAAIPDATADEEAA